MQRCVRRRPPHQFAGREAAHTQPDANAVIDDELEGCAGPIAEDEQRARERVLLQGADLSHANLSHAFPIEANLSYAVLRKTNLSGAALHEANLRGAHLEGADLRDARGVTEEELEQQAENLEGTIMPDGSKHP